MSDKQVSVEMDVVTAAHARKILFEHQKPYSYTFPPERIVLIRELILQLDEVIESSLKTE